MVRVESVLKSIHIKLESILSRLKDTEDLTSENHDNIEILLNYKEQSEEDINSLKQYDISNDGIISDINGELSSVKDTINNLKPTVLENEENISNLFSEVETNKENIQTINGNLSNDEKDIRNIKQNIVDISNKLKSTKDSLEANTTSLQNQITENKTKLDAYDQRLLFLLDEVTEHHYDIEHLKKNDQNVEEIIQLVNSRISDITKLKSDVEALQSNDTTFRENLTKVSSKANKNESDISAIKLIVNSNLEKLNKYDLDDISNKLDDFEDFISEIENLRVKVSGNSTALNELKSKTDINSSSLQMLLDESASNKDKLTEIYEKLLFLLDEVTEHHNDIDKLKQGIGTGGSTGGSVSNEPLFSSILNVDYFKEIGYGYSETINGISGLPNGISGNGFKLENSDMTGENKYIEQTLTSFDCQIYKRIGSINGSSINWGEWTKLNTSTYSIKNIDNSIYKELSFNS